MRPEDTVCAVVVTFNRKNYLMTCLESLENQTRPPEAILVVDNASTDGTPQALRERGYLREIPPDANEIWETSGDISVGSGQKIKLHYIRLPENTGGAGGFYHGVKRAYELGYHWIWLMDDDVWVDERALEFLCEKATTRGLLATTSLLLTRERKPFLYSRGHIIETKLFPTLQRPLLSSNYSETSLSIDFSSFVGLMVNRKLISRVGFPNPEFFIYNDDVEYCIRINRLGKIVMVPSSIIVDQNAKKEHGFLSKKILFFTLKRAPISSYWRTYYSLRNSLYIGKKYSKGKFFFYIRVILHIIKGLRSLVLILLIDDHKWDRLKIRFLPYWHGLRGKLGKRVEYKNGKLVWY